MRGIRSPGLARAGIAVVFQEILVAALSRCSTTSGSAPTGCCATAIADAPKSVKRAEAALAELLDVPPALEHRCASCRSATARPAASRGRWSATAGADPRRGDVRAGRRDARVAIRDPARSWRPAARRHLHLPPHGRGRGVADRMTVLRSGESVETLPRGDARRATRATDDRRGPSHRRRRRRAVIPRDGDAVLRLRGVGLRPDAAPIDIDAPRGRTRRPGRAGRSRPGASCASCAARPAARDGLRSTTRTPT